MTDNKKLYMTVVSERNNVLQVDLSKPVLDATKNEVPISIRDALVFLELAQFITPDSGNITGNLMQMMSFFSTWLNVLNFANLKIKMHERFDIKESTSKTKCFEIL